jgi:Ca2+-binding RTX toxin-like protein
MAATYVDALWNGVDFWRWNYGAPIGTGSSVTYSFATEFPSYYYDGLGNLDIIDGGFSAFNSDQRAAAQAVLATYAEITNLTFTNLGNGEGGDIVFGMNAQSGSAGYAFYPGDTYAGDVWIANSPDWVLETNLDVTPGTYGYLTLVHELGHAMGLKHPFDVEDAEIGGNQVVLDAAHDTYQYSVMSYTHQPNEVFLRLHTPGVLSGADYFDVYPAGPSLYDIAALQYLYGANMSTRATNTTYTFDPATPFFKCIWDGGGKDTISVANFSLGCRIDLNAGKFSDIMILPDAIPTGWSGSLPTYDGKNNLSIAFGAVIENATGGSGADSLTGNNVVNVLSGNAGNDKLAGAGGGDTLIGGKGKDQLIGGGGADKFVFNAAPSNATADTIKDFLHGTDKVQLDNSVFTTAGADGALASGAFYAGTAAHDASDRVVYDKVSGNLYYDPDGTGAQAKVLVAVLIGSPDNVSFGDFRVI